MLCQVGTVEVWRLLEMCGPFMSPGSLFPNAGGDVAETLERHAPGCIDAATGKLIIPVQGFLLKTPQQVIVVDTGVGTHKANGVAEWAGRTDTRFMAALAASGVAPEDVDLVLNTHLHPDHVGWNTRLEGDRWVPTFPKARYVFPAADVAMHEAHPSSSYRESILPVLEAGQVDQVQAPAQLADQIDLIATPGHSPGHMSVRIRSRGEEAVIAGDALHTAAQCSHPEWHFRFDADPVQAEASRRALLALLVETGARVIVPHVALPSIGRVTRAADGAVWLPDGAGPAGG